MANLKDLKNRIGSVKSTQKITKAMQMVAASKLRRAQERAELARPYSEKMERMITTLAASANPENAPALLTGNGKEDIHLIVVMTSDRGLCGGFNSNLVRATKTKVRELEDDGKTVKLFVVGKKGLDQLSFGYGEKIVDRINDLGSKKQVEYSNADDIAARIIKLFDEGEIDVCHVVYNKFISVITQEITFQQLIPLEISGSEEETTSDAVYEYEPSEEAVLEELLPKNIGVQFYHSMLESAASEQGARMSAMDNATRNAGEMINKLSLVYNRTRQAAITTELTEIISGAEAL
jgi:F-type H+-transporting ATPase subunit gamma